MKKYPSRFCALLLVFLLLLPLLPTHAFAVEDPNILAEHVLLMDANHDEVLYEKAADEKAYPASITKVMTALLVFEAIDRGELTLDTVVTPTSAITYDLSADGSSLGIKPGEQMTVNNLLHCMLIASANEACNILAEAVCGDISTFIERMNTRAQELGCTGTHFSNAHGLHQNDHYTTAHDIYLFVKAAMEYKVFREIVDTERYTVPATNLSEERTFYTTNALISNWKYIGYTYSNAIGIKTGHTPEAGQCLVAAAVDGDDYLISVVLGAQVVTRADGTTDQQSFSETKRLFQWGFDNFERRTILDGQSLMREVKVAYSPDKDYVVVQPAGALEYTLPKDVAEEDFTFTVNLPSEPVEAPIEKGQVLGTVTISYDGREYGTVDLVANASLSRSAWLYRLAVLQNLWSTTWFKIVVLLVAVAIVVLVLRLTLFRRSRRFTGHRRRAYRGNRRYTGGRRRR